MCQKVFYGFIQGHKSAAVLCTVHCIPFNLLNGFCRPALPVLLLQVDVSWHAELAAECVPCWWFVQQKYCLGFVGWALLLMHPPLSLGQPRLHGEPLAARGWWRRNMGWQLEVTKTVTSWWPLVNWEQLKGKRSKAIEYWWSQKLR